MKKIFSFVAATLMAATMFAGRTFESGEALYLNASAVTWWQNGGAVQIATFFDGTENHKVVGTEAADPSKVKFVVPAGTYETVVFSRHASEEAEAWNWTGAISFEGSEGKNMVATFAEKSTEVTWGTYDGAGVQKPECPEALYMIGDVNDNGWKPENGILMTKEGNKFTVEGTFVANGTNEVCYFAFTTVKDNDWDVVNANRWGAMSNLEAGKAVELKGKGEYNAIIAPGKYVITIDWDAYTVTAEASTTAVENAEAAVKAAKKIVNGQLVIVRGENIYDLTGAAL